MAGSYRGPDAERVTVGELLYSYKVDLQTRGAKSMASFEAHAKAVREAIGHLRAVELTADVVNSIRRAWLDAKEPKAEATTDWYLEVLRAAYKLAVKQKRIGADRVPYIELIRPNNRRTGFVDGRDVLEDLRKPPGSRGVMLPCSRTGRLSAAEVEGLTWENVDEKAREARLQDSKNGRGRVLPLEGELWDAIRRRKAARYRFRFPWCSIAPASRSADWRKSWRSACEAAGVPGLPFHDLRRSAVRNLTRRGVPAVVAMEITGHRTRSVFDRYGIPTTDEAREALRKCFGGENSYGTATV